MNDNVGKFYILNDSVKVQDEIDKLDISKFDMVYEVIRIIEGIPLFFEDHYERLTKSLELLKRKNEITFENLRHQVIKTVEKNGLKLCNVKVIVYNDQTRQNCLTYISKSYYPGKREIEEGVPTALFSWERNNPNVKLLNHEYKERVSRTIEEKQVFEVLLVNENQIITEGSRSNAFFVKGNTIYTAPGELVLKGITRKYVFDACKRVGVDICESLISVTDLDKIDGLFISGTSIKVLPVSKIDDRVYASSKNPVIVAVRDEFNKIMDDYIKSRI